MASECFLLETAGGEVSIPKTDLLSLEVELDADLASMFRLRLATRQRRSGGWTYVDDEQFRPWKPLKISGGFTGRVTDLMSGYITHVRPDFPANAGQCSLEIWGLDRSVLLDREEHSFAWPNETDSTIAAKIFDRYGLAPVVTATETRHDDTVSTIIQRETDMQFLKRLALRNGFECYVDGQTGFFLPPPVAADPQPVLAVHFGAETNVNRVSLETNALAPTDVTLCQVGRTSKETLQETLTAGRQKTLGAVDATGLLSPGIRPRRVNASLNAAVDHSEMRAFGQGLFHQAEWFVSVVGEIDAQRYGHVLKPHGTVVIKGVGATYSGVYYVTHVTHTFTPKGYTQAFRAKRNALRPASLEEFDQTTARLTRVS